MILNGNNRKVEKYKMIGKLLSTWTQNFIKKINTILDGNNKKVENCSKFITIFYYAVIVGIVAGLFHWIVN